MKLKLLLCVVSISMLALGGCATTKEGKPATGSTAKGADTKAAKPLTANDVITRYRKAVYGGDGANKRAAVTTKGTFSVEQFSVEGPFVSYAMAPDSGVTNIEVMGMTLSNGCHKGVCWAQQPGAGTTTLSGGAAAMQLQQFDMFQWEHIDRYYTSLEIVPPADGQEGPNTKIKGVKKSGDADYYEFSKETGLMASAVIEGETAQGHMKIPMQFKNYKSFDGMTVATEVTQSTPQATVKLTVSEVSFAPISEDKFAKPN